MRRIASALAVAVVLLAGAPASAHENKPVGKYTFTVGWGDEPAYAGFKNSVSLRVEDAAEKPVADIGDGVKVEVTTGSEKVTLPMRAAFGDPGHYEATLIPTRPGTYTFHFTGTVRGEAIDVTFTSSETTFDDIKPPSEVQFPAKDPAVSELTQRITRSEQRALGVADTAKDDAGLARILGFAGIALGAIALGIALAGRARRG
jgi:hypothetical protein